MIERFFLFTPSNLIKGVLGCLLYQTILHFNVTSIPNDLPQHSVGLTVIRDAM